MATITRRVIKDGNGKVLHEEVRGLGDAVARVAKPIARIIDKALATKLEDCETCAERQELLNKAFPFKPNK